MDADERSVVLRLREIDAEPVPRPTVHLLNSGIVAGRQDSGAVGQNLTSHRHSASIGETAFSMAAMSK